MNLGELKLDSRRSGNRAPVWLASEFPISMKNKPDAVVAYLKAKTEEKRKRRSNKHGASAYAKSNWPRKT